MANFELYVPACVRRNCPEGAQAGRVFQASRGHFRLYTADGECAVQLAGLFRDFRPADLPTVGDWVFFESGLIRGMAQRWSRFSRRAAGTREEEQVLAANVDTVFLVCGLDLDFNLRRLERYLVLAHESGAGPVIVLNKADLCPEDLPSRTAKAREISSGAPVICTSTRTPGGVDSLLCLLEAGSTAALLGSSGAGKSSIVNCLVGGTLRTQKVREHDGRGRHTTTSRELYILPHGAFLMDTPGLRELQLWAGEESIAEAFDEIAELAAECRFRDCRHQGEPGCAVGAAMTRGVLDAGRLESYHKLTSEIRRLDKKSLKQMHRAARSFYKNSPKYKS